MIQVTKRFETDFVPLYRIGSTAGMTLQLFQQFSFKQY